MLGTARLGNSRSSIRSPGSTGPLKGLRISGRLQTFSDQPEARWLGLGKRESQLPEEKTVELLVWITPSHRP